MSESRPGIHRKSILSLLVGFIYFCFDFCYALNGLCMAIVGLDLCGARRPPALFAAAFALANGPLLAAILVWRNSFIFHSLDHVTSTMLHALPPIWTYAVRWTDADERQPLDYAACYGGALAFYVAWQLLYIFKTEIVDADYIRHHPDEFTSLRWITRDGRNGMHRLCKRAMVAMDLMRPGEAFDETTKKTKLTFWAAQLVYTILTLLPVPLVWHSKTVHAAFLVFMFTTAVYNGASYYIEIFSKRYNLKFDKVLDPPEAARKEAADDAPPRRDRDHAD